MSSILGLPSNICKIPDEIDKHGKNIAKEVEVMGAIVDEQGDHINSSMKFHGDNITREMQLMRESFVEEMGNLNRKTRNTVFAVVAVNIASRFFFR
jgi:hypothetical protein